VRRPTVRSVGIAAPRVNGTNLYPTGFPVCSERYKLDLKANFETRFPLHRFKG
jgi:hypothetical protein